MSNISRHALTFAPAADDSSHFALDALVDDALAQNSGHFDRSGMFRSARAGASPLSLAPLTVAPRSAAAPTSPALLSSRTLEVLLATLVLTLLVTASAVGLTVAATSAPQAMALGLNSPDPSPVTAWAVIPFEAEKPPVDLVVELEPETPVAKTARKKTRAPARPAAKPTTAAKPTVAKVPADPHAGLTVECILDPSSCTTGKAKGKVPAAATTSTGKEKLTTADIRIAMAPVKGNAKRCAALGSVSGDKVRVKLSVDGATGRVKSATPLAPFNNAVGQCVANALDDAVFPAVDKTATGIVYSVTM